MKGVIILGEGTHNTIISHCSRVSYSMPFATKDLECCRDKSLCFLIMPVHILLIWLSQH